MNMKYCVKCGRQFETVGREVICPSCREAAKEEAKRAAVLKAKRASWAGESVPVRISGRASTVIREYAAANGMAFAESLDALIKASDFFGGIGVKWEDVEPYKSHRRDKHATQDTASKPQDAPQDAASKPQNKPIKQAARKPQEVTKAAKVTSKTVKVTGKSSSKK